MKKILVSVLILAGLVMTGCENFLAETDLKEKLNDTITIAKSQDVKLKIASDRDYYGIFLDKMEGDFTFKMKQTVTVRFHLDPACSFKRWMIADSVTGKEIEDAVKVIDEITETENGSEVHTIKFTFLKSLPNLQLKPVCFLKNDTTAPEFTAFEVYNLGTYDEENEENNVLVTDKVFEEWTEDEDYENHHVNGLKLKFTVREDESPIENCTVKVVEKLIKKIDGTDASIIKQSVIHLNSENVTNETIGNGLYRSTVNYKFNNAYDGVIKVYFIPVDVAGNEDNENIVTYSVVKDTVMTPFKFTEYYDYDVGDTVFRKAYLDGNWYTNLCFNYAICNYSNENVTNLLLDNGEDGYGTFEGFCKFMTKYILYGNLEYIEDWYDGHESEFNLSVEFSEDGKKYEPLYVREDEEESSLGKKYLVHERIKQFSDEVDYHTSKFDWIYVYYFDVTDYKKAQNLYFKFIWKDSVGNEKVYYWDNSNRHSAKTKEAFKIRSSYQINIDELSNPPPAYCWSDIIKLVTTGTGGFNVDSRDVFYAVETDDGQWLLDSTRGIKDPDTYSNTYFSYMWYGDAESNYLTADQLKSMYSYGNRDTENPDTENPSKYQNLKSIYIWNISSLKQAFDDEEAGYWETFDDYEISDAVKISADNIAIVNDYDETEELDTFLYKDNETNLYSITFEYKGDEHFWQLFVEFNGVLYESEAGTVNKDKVFVSNLSANTVKDVNTVNAYAKYYDGRKFYFNNKTFSEPLADVDTEAPVYEWSYGKKVTDYYQNLNYVANSEIFTFSDESFSEGEIIEVKVYYTDDFGKNNYSSEIIKSELPHIKIYSEPVKTYVDEYGYINGYGYADVIFDYSFLTSDYYYIFFVITDNFNNELIYGWNLDNSLFRKKLTLENKDNYVESACNEEFIFSHYHGVIPEVDSYSVHDSDGAETDFVYCFGYNVENSGYPNTKYSNTVYYEPESITYYKKSTGKGDVYEITKAEKEEIDSSPDSGWITYVRVEGSKICNSKNITINDDNTVYLIFCDQNVLVEYLVSDKFLSDDDGDYWEHHTSNDNKTFTQLTVANPGQTTVKGYKIPKVPAGKYGFIIFHFADGTTMNSGVIEG